MNLRAKPHLCLSNSDSRNPLNMPLASDSLALPHPSVLLRVFRRAFYKPLARVYSHSRLLMYRLIIACQLELNGTRS